MAQSWATFLHVPQDALDNPLVLPLLGLLAEQSTHGYGLVAALRQRGLAGSARTGTVYTLLGSLERAGLVMGRSPAPEGRTSYRLTAAGLSELADRVEREVIDAEPTRLPRFVTALAWLGALPPDRAAAALEQRLHALDVQRRELGARLDRNQAPELHMIEGAYLHSHLAHDRQWLRRTIRRIRSGDLPWPQ